MNMYTVTACAWRAPGIVTVSTTVHKRRANSAWYYDMHDGTGEHICIMLKECRCVCVCVCVCVCARMPACMHVCVCACVCVLTECAMDESDLFISLTQIKSS